MFIKKLFSQSHNDRSYSIKKLQKAVKDKTLLCYFETEDDSCQYFNGSHYCVVGTLFNVKKIDEKKLMRDKSNGACVGDILSELKIKSAFGLGEAELIKLQKYHDACMWSLSCDKKSINLNNFEQYVNSLR